MGWRFLPYEQTRAIPNVIVDGARNEATRLTLSHWPQSGTPPDLLAESWVQLASRRPALRVNLAALADELNLEEGGGGRWVFDGVDEITPRLHLEGVPASSIAPERIVARVEHHLRSGPPAWNPYE